MSHLPRELGSPRTCATLGTLKLCKEMHIWMDSEDTISSNTPRLPLASAQATAVWCFPSRKAWWFGDNWAWVWIPPGSSTGLTWLNYLHLLGLCSLRWWKGQWFSLHLVTWGLNEITWNEGFEHCLDKINTKKKNAIMIFHHQFMSLSSCRIEPCLVASSFIFKVHHPDLYFCPHTSSFTSLTFSPLP